MCRSRAILSIALIVSLIAVCPAHAIFIPALPLPATKKQAEAERNEPYWDTVTRRAMEEFRRPVGGLAASFDYRYSQQDLSNSSALGPFSSETELNSYSLRPEFVPFNWISVYGIAALYDGTNKGTGRAKGFNLNLDGWGAGVGTTLSLGLPRWLPAWWKEGAIDPLFILPDFNWTHNEFQDVINDVDVINVTTRIGAGARNKMYNWGLYGGPMYQTSTRDLTVKTALGNARVESEPKDAWSGVIGAFFGVRISSKPKRQVRPTLLATIEGGVGNRQGVLITLRYEYDFLESAYETVIAPAAQH